MKQRSKKTRVKKIMRKLSQKLKIVAKKFCLSLLIAIILAVSFPYEFRFVKETGKIEVKRQEAQAAIAYDAGSESHTGTTGSTSQASFTWNHTPSGTPKGVLVFVFTNADENDISSVTYGGTTMTRVTGGQAIDTTGEPGRTDTFFLGASVPTGQQAVVVNRTNNATVMYAAAITVTAATNNTRPVGFVLLQNDGTLAEQSVDDGSPGSNSVRFAGINSGLSTIGTVAAGNTSIPGANSTRVVSIDFGNRVVDVVRETTAGQGSRPVGFVAATSDDRAAVHLAVVESYVFTTLTTDKGDYPTLGETISSTNNQVNNNSGTNLTGTYINYVIFIDGNSNGIPDGTEQYTDNGCADWKAWGTGGGYTWQKTGLNVTSGSSATDSQSCANTNFPSNTTYTLYAKWWDGASTTYDTKYVTFSSVPTTGFYLLILLVLIAVYITYRAGYLKIRRPAFQTKTSSLALKKNVFEVRDLGFGKNKIINLKKIIKKK